MTEQRTINFEDLKKPFPPSDIEWRIGQAGKGRNGFWAKVLAYITNRAIMDRLDEVCGPENWRNEFREWHGDGKNNASAQLCGISIRINGEWITKWDGAPNTDFESVKGGLSDAMKRAAVQWGIGRYLYDLGESWAEICDNGVRRDKIKIDENGKKRDEWIRWNPPKLPRWAVTGDRPPEQPEPSPQAPADEPQPGQPNAPKPNGKAGPSKNGNGKPADGQQPPAHKKWEDMTEDERVVLTKRVIVKACADKARLGELREKVPQQGFSEDNQAELLRLIDGLWLVEDWAPHGLTTGMRVKQLTESLGKAGSYDEVRAVREVIPCVITDKKAIGTLNKAIDEVLATDTATV